MIFKNNLKITKVEVIINEKEFKIMYNFFLSDDRVWSFRTEKLDPKVFFDRGNLELNCIHYLAVASTKLKKELDGNKTREDK